MQQLAEAKTSARSGLIRISITKENIANKKMASAQSKISPKSLKILNQKGLKCPLPKCKKVVGGMMNRHLARHYVIKIYEVVPPVGDNQWKCPICLRLKSYDNINNYVRHVGAVHNLIIKCCEEDGIDLVGEIEKQEPKKKYKRKKNLLMKRRSIK